MISYHLQMIKWNNNSDFSEQCLLQTGIIRRCIIMQGSVFSIFPRLVCHTNLTQNIITQSLPSVNWMTWYLKQTKIRSSFNLTRDVVEQLIRLLKRLVIYWLGRNSYLILSIHWLPSAVSKKLLKWKLIKNISLYPP